MLKCHCGSPRYPNQGQCPECIKSGVVPPPKRAVKKQTPKTKPPATLPNTPHGWAARYLINLLKEIDRHMNTRDEALRLARQTKQVTVFYDLLSKVDAEERSVSWKLDRLRLMYDRETLTRVDVNCAIERYENRAPLFLEMSKDPQTD